MGRQRIYKILLSDEDKKILNAKIQNKKHVKPLYAAALFCLNWMKITNSILHMRRLRNLTGSARQLYQDVCYTKINPVYTL